MEVSIVDAAGNPVTFPAVTVYKWKRDIAVGSAKSFTVPAALRWIVSSIYLSYHCSATAGNRVPHVTFYDSSSNLIFDASWQINQPANQTYPYVAYPGSVTQQTNPPFSIAIPTAVLPAGYVVKVWDAAAIDPAADTATVSMSYGEF